MIARGKVTIGAMNESRSVGRGGGGGEEEEAELSLSNFMFQSCNNVLRFGRLSALRQICSSSNRPQSSTLSGLSGGARAHLPARNKEKHEWREHTQAHSGVIVIWNWTRQPLGEGEKGEKSALANQSANEAGLMSGALAGEQT